ncbi:MAG: zinc-dependent metalloprotease family protein [Pseudomonadota bacterium]
MFKITQKLAAAVLAFATFNANALVIDIAIIYSDQSASESGNINAWIDQTIADANYIYSINNVRGNDGSLVEVRVVDIESTTAELTPSSSWLDAVRTSTWVDDIRTNSRADLVVALGVAEEIFENGQLVGYVCGIGYLGQVSGSSLRSDLGFSVTSVDCGWSTFTHELGHNMGLAHASEQGGVGSIFDYGRGYGVNNDFATIMAYPQSFGSATQIPYFSNPGLTTDNTGRAMGREDFADSHRAMGPVVDSIANFN